MKKRFIALFIATNLLFASLTGCAANSGQQENNQPSAAPSAEPSAEAEPKSEASSEKPKITYAEPGWQSSMFVNQVMEIVIGEGYGYPIEPVNATNVALVTAVTNNEVDIHTYIAEIAFESYQELKDSGKILEWGAIHNDGVQGVYVPSYMINGDKERGIDPITPDLKTIKDLIKYKDIFADPEDPTKGLFVNAPADYLAATVLDHKLKAYGITDHFNILTLGSQGASDASLDAAYKKGEPWVGYGFVVSYAYGQYDLFKLEDEAEYDPELYTPENNYTCDFPHDNYMVTSSTSFPDKAPELLDFLKKFHLSGPIISKGIGYMTDNNNDARGAAIEWMKANAESWSTWVDDKVAANIQAYLDKQ
jgi:glycine betaine/proline transport system substrate-binding protein